MFYLHMMKVFTSNEDPVDIMHCLAPFNLNLINKNTFLLPTLASFSF